MQAIHSLSNAMMYLDFYTLWWKMSGVFISICPGHHGQLEVVCGNDSAVEKHSFVFNTA